MKQKNQEGGKRIKAGIEGVNECHTNKILRALEETQRKADLIAYNTNNFDDSVVCNGSCQSMFEDKEDASF